MPIPFIIGAVALAAGATGVKKGFDAKRDMKEAKEINESARTIAKESEEFIEMAKGKTKEAIEALGREKINILATTITDFITNFERIKNINLKDSEGINELKNFNSSSESFKQLKDAAFEAKKIAVNGLAAVGSGALIAYGTYSLVMSGLGGVLLASTGTAIGSLSGAAAVNATLAWLGGGSLAAGGFGMMGGMVVLGGLVAGPALAIGGIIMASQAQKALNDSYGNYDKAKAFKAQAKNIGIALKGIVTRANQLTELLQKLNCYFKDYVDNMAQIINSKGSDWNEYNNNEKVQIFKCVQMAQTIKIILDTSLLSENGELDEATNRVVNEGNSYLLTINNI